MKLYGIDESGQLSFVRRETGFHCKDYIISPNRYPFIKERRPVRYFMYETYANEDGAPSNNSRTTKPWDYGLAEETARVGMLVCFFYREHHHYSGTKALILRITHLDDVNQVFHATMVDCGYINRMRHSPYWSLIQHGDRALTSDCALPYNRNQSYKEEKLFLHGRGSTYYATTEHGVQKWTADTTRGTLFGHFFYGTEKGKHTSHFIPLQPVTYTYVQAHTKKFFNRVRNEWRYQLQRCVVRGGKDIIAVKIDDVLHVLTHHGEKTFRLIQLENLVVETSIKKIAPLILPQWDIEKTNRMNVSPCG